MAMQAMGKYLGGDDLLLERPVFRFFKFFDQHRVGGKALQPRHSRPGKPFHEIKRIFPSTSMSTSLLTCRRTVLCLQTLEVER